MKLTLLKITQDILNDMDSDEVNSIDDTVESQQVANIVRQCFFELIANRNWPHLKKFITLDSSGTSAKPTHFRVPENMKELIQFNYDCRRPEDGNKLVYQEVRYIYPDEFLRMTSVRNSTSANVQTVVLDNGIKLLVFTDKPPQYWTSFDDDFIVCDSYQNTIESTLQSSKTQVMAYMEPSWKHTDDGIPDLPSEAFPMLVEESKSTAFFVLKQMVNQKAETKAQRQQRWLSRKAWRTHGGVRYANFGRRSVK
jgi:hypothetical protein